MSAHKKMILFNDRRVFIPYGYNWVTLDANGDVKAWREKPKASETQWTGSESVLCETINMKDIHWQGMIMRVEYSTQKDQVYEALKTPMTIIELFKTLDHISPNNIAPLVTNLYLDKMVFKVGVKDEKWKSSKKPHVIWSSNPDDKEKDKRFRQVMPRVYTNLMGVKPPDPKYIKGKRVHSCNDD